MWYTPIGWFATTLVGIFVSWLTKFNEPNKMNPKLFSPGTHWLLDSLPQKWQRKLNWTQAELDDKDKQKSNTE